MISNRRVLEVSRDKVLLIEERYAGYRAELIQALTAAILTQQEGLSENGRHDRVTRIVDALGGKVVAKSGNS